MLLWYQIRLLDFLGMFHKFFPIILYLCQLNSPKTDNIHKYYFVNCPLPVKV